MMARRRKIVFLVLACIGAAGLVFAGYEAFKRVPTEGDWQTPLSRLSTAEFNGNLVTVRNVRNFRYNGSESDADIEAAYDDRTYDLSTLSKVWYVTEPFKSFAGAAHTFLSFEFSDGRFLSISIEARKFKGQEYDVFLGLFRTYPLTYIAADERDSIIVRTNVRKSKVYVYPVKLSNPENARLLLKDMLERMNELAVHPAWYNTLTANCTSLIADHVNRVSPHRIKGFAWQLFLTAYADELALKSGLLDTDLPIEEARNAFYVTEKSQRITQRLGYPEEYSRLIRE
jgi:hypothetical protein